MFLVRGLRTVRKSKYIRSLRYFQNASCEDVPDVSPSLIKRAFKVQNVPFKEGYTCFTTLCPICKLNKNTDTATLYINKTTGLFMCPKCKHSGEWSYLEPFMSHKEKKVNVNIDEILSFSTKIRESVLNIQKNKSHINCLSKKELDILLTELKLPLISKSTLSSLDIRVDCSAKKIYFPLENANSEIVGYRTISKDSTFSDSKCGGLLKGVRSPSDDSAILVENPADFLALFAADINLTVICLPNGIKSLPQYVLPALEKYKKLVLWLGNDIPSWDASKKFGKKLGEKRCFCVRPNNQHVLPHLNIRQNYTEIIQKAQSLSHKSITTFASLREDVLSDLQNIQQVEGVKWTKFPVLNKILKGHRLGELTIVTGPTGSGKTTFISEYSLDLAMQGVNTLWGSFEIRNSRLARTMLQQMVQVPLEQNLDQFDRWADQFELLPIYYMTFHGQQSIKIVMDAVEHAAYVHDINHVIIDNVQFMMGITDENKHMDRFWKQDAIVASFRSFATRKNCHVTLVIHPRKERVDEDLTTNSIFGGAKASQEADNVLLIQDKRLTGPRGKKFLQIAKNRYSGDLGVMPLDFNKESLSYATKKKLKIEKNCPPVESVEVA